MKQIDLMPLRPACGDRSAIEDLVARIPACGLFADPQDMHSHSFRWRAGARFKAGECTEVQSQSKHTRPAA
jgi:hypothetical protein